jgi:hypothetical protein
VLAYSAIIRFFEIWGNRWAIRNTTIGVFIFIILLNEQNPHCTLDRQQAYQKDNTCGVEGGTTLTSFKNTVNAKIPFAVAWKA